MNEENMGEVDDKIIGESNVKYLTIFPIVGIVVAILANIRNEYTFTIISLLLMSISLTLLSITIAIVFKTWIIYLDNNKIVIDELFIGHIIRHTTIVGELLEKVVIEIDETNENRNIRWIVFINKNKSFRRGISLHGIYFSQIQLSKISRYLNSNDKFIEILEE